ncbi:zona pellucida sperm-binding protein 3-like [Trichosurus vulpecula]|uniref:zona pellucida sperm-binding protein 3-like n=1 Tax=Trichosurus vulpecula TaxID=9337 RepID=UPI00186B0497|nr:zona pellucida sperm-binding protein 3-like [Trichosurus vulpecula]
MFLLRAEGKAWWQLLMAFCWCLRLEVSASFLADDALLQECNGLDILLAVKKLPSLDDRYLHLGSCAPSRAITRPGYVVFAGPLKACGFSQLTSGRMVEFFADLVYSPPPWLSAQPYLEAFSHRVNCTYTGLEAPTPSQVSSVTGSLSGMGHLDFSVRLWPGNLGNSTTVTLGSELQVEFSVTSDFQQPLQLYVDTCVAYPGPAQNQPGLRYNVIENYGCFVDSREARSRFLPRAAPETLLLSLQAFRFTELDSDVHLHCHLLVGDPKVPSDSMKKACSFDRETNRWVLLDDPSMSSICHCCETRCLPNQPLHRRDLAGGPLDLLLLILGSLLLTVMLLAILATAFCFRTRVQQKSQTWARWASPTGNSASSAPQNA